MPLSSIPRISGPSSASTDQRRPPLLIVFLSFMLAVYIGFISYWLITDDSNADLAASSEAQVQAVVETQ
jgi:hypothetical protein